MEHLNNGQQNKDCLDINEYRIRRNSDIAQEGNMKVLLNQVYKENGFVNPIRVIGKNYQMKGIDIILAYNNKILRVDEKAATSAWNRNLSTFAFELYSKVNYHNLGWFSKECDSMTTHYMLVWVRAHDAEITKPISLDCLLIEKAAVWNYIDSHHILDGLNEKTITEKLDAINPNKKRIITIDEDFKIMQTLKFKAEQPINLLIPRKLLNSLAELHIYKNYNMPCSVVV